MRNLDDKSVAGSGFLRCLLYGVAPVLGLDLAISLALLFPLVHLNAVEHSWRQVGALLGYLIAFHGMLLAWTAVAAALIVRRSSSRASLAPNPAWVGCWVVGLGLGSFVALNSGLRFTGGSSLHDRFVTPLALWNQSVFLLAIPVLGWLMGTLGAPTRDATRRARRASRLAVVGWLVLFLATVSFNLRTEKPKPPALRNLVTPASAVAESAAASSGSHSVVLIGIDGLSWNVIASLFERGEMPNLHQLVRRGSRGALRSHVPTKSPQLWNSVATGRHAEDHGIFGFSKFYLPGVQSAIANGPPLGTTYWWNGFNGFLGLAADRHLIRQEPYSSGDRKAPAIWDVADHWDRSVGVVCWMNTFPTRPLKPGSYMVSDFSLRPASAFPHPATLESLQRAHPLEPQWQALPVVRSDEQLRRSWQNGNDTIHRSIDLLSRYKPSIALTYLHDLDSIQHRYWRPGAGLLFLARQDPDASFTPQIRATYMLVDEWFGAFSTAAGSEATLILVSDHGFCFDGRYHDHAPDGVLLIAGPGVRENHLVESASIFDVFPTVLAIAGLPLEEGLPGRVLEEVFLPGASPTPQRVARYSWFKPMPSGASGQEIERQRLQEFKSLGYIN